jgi:hypothetical protein
MNTSTLTTVSTGASISITAGENAPGASIVPEKSTTSTARLVAGTGTLTTTDGSTDSTSTKIVSLIVRVPVL